MAPVGGDADDRVGADAGALHAGVARGARVPVVAPGAVRRVRRGAEAFEGVAGAGEVAAVDGGAHDGRAPHARAGLARVARRARVAIVARRVVERGGRGARAGARIARARDVAIVERAADDGVAADARAVLAGVGGGAGVAVVAVRSVGCLRRHAGTRRRVAGGGQMAGIGRLTFDRVADARAADAHIAGRATIAVVARLAVGEARFGVRATGERREQDQSQ